MPSRAFSFSVEKNIENSASPKRCSAENDRSPFSANKIMFGTTTESGVRAPTTPGRATSRPSTTDTSSIVFSEGCVIQSSVEKNEGLRTRPSRNGVVSRLTTRRESVRKAPAHSTPAHGRSKLTLKGADESRNPPGLVSPLPDHSAYSQVETTTSSSSPLS